MKAQACQILFLIEFGFYFKIFDTFKINLAAHGLAEGPFESKACAKGQSECPKDNCDAIFECVASSESEIGTGINTKKKLKLITT